MGEDKPDILILLEWLKGEMRTAYLFLNTKHRRPHHQMAIDIVKDCQQAIDNYQTTGELPPRTDWMIKHD
jgi:hypothetical protein